MRLRAKFNLTLVAIIAAAAVAALYLARAQFERDALVQLLKLTGGNVAQAARIAKRNRTEFYRLLQKHGLTPGLFRGDDEGGEAAEPGTEPPVAD